MKLTIVDADRCVGCQSCMFACARRLGHGGLGGSCLGVRSVGGMERGFTVIICRACADPACARVCPTDALVPQPGGGVRLSRDACIGCGRCRSACIVGAVFWDDGIDKPTICVHCGICARYCPHHVLAVEGEEAADGRG